MKQHHLVMPRALKPAPDDPMKRHLDGITDAWASFDALGDTPYDINHKMPLELSVIAVRWGGALMIYGASGN